MNQQAGHPIRESGNTLQCRLLPSKSQSAEYFTLCSLAAQKNGSSKPKAQKKLANSCREAKVAAVAPKSVSQRAGNHRSRAIISGVDALVSRRRLIDIVVHLDRSGPPTPVSLTPPPFADSIGTPAPARR